MRRGEIHYIQVKEHVLLQYLLEDCGRIRAGQLRGRSTCTGMSTTARNACIDDTLGLGTEIKITRFHSHLLHA